MSRVLRKRSGFNQIFLYALGSDRQVISKTMGVDCHRPQSTALYVTRLRRPVHEIDVTVRIEVVVQNSKLTAVTEKHIPGRLMQLICSRLSDRLRSTPYSS